RNRDYSRHQNPARPEFESESDDIAIKTAHADWAIPANCGIDPVDQMGTTACVSHVGEGRLHSEPIRGMLEKSADVRRLWVPDEQQSFAFKRLHTHSARDIGGNRAGDASHLRRSSCERV